MTPEDKLPYDQLAQQEKMRYGEALKEYNAVSRLPVCLLSFFFLTSPSFDSLSTILILFVSLFVKIAFILRVYVRLHYVSAELVSRSIRETNENWDASEAHRISFSYQKN